MLHAFFAFVLLSSIIVHIATIWVKGSVEAMLSGKVSSAWARKHRLWYDEMRKKNVGRAGGLATQETDHSTRTRVVTLGSTLVRCLFLTLVS